MSRKTIGIWVLLALVIGITALLDANFLQPLNLQNILRWSGMYGILALGMSFVLITGGVDLSVGSLVGLTGSLFALVLREYQWHPLAALPAILLFGTFCGWMHGLLITKLRLQPFVVTLCGLFIYRGLARWVAGDATQGFGDGHLGLSYLTAGKPFSLPIPGVGSTVVPMPFLIFLSLAILAAVFMQRSIFGRYLLALGRNEQAARYSGIRTDRLIITAYMLSGLAAGMGGILFSLDLNSVQPSSLGNFFELYAIAGAVLGGCSLRGGEGTILGVVAGILLVRVLYNAINILRIPAELEYAVVGLVILIGVAMDESIRRIGERRLKSRSP